MIKVRVESGDEQVRVVVKSESVSEQIKANDWLFQGRSEKRCTSAPGVGSRSNHHHDDHDRHDDHDHDHLQVVDTDGKTVLATLKAGSYFGEISILNMGTAGPS